MQYEEGARLYSQKKTVSPPNSRSPLHGSFAFSAIKANGIGELAHIMTLDEKGEKNTDSQQ